jgi:hypothetical protein
VFEAFVAAAMTAAREQEERRVARIRIADLEVPELIEEYEVADLQVHWQVQQEAQAARLCDTLDARMPEVLAPIRQFRAELVRSWADPNVLGDPREIPPAVPVRIYEPGWRFPERLGWMQAVADYVWIDRRVADDAFMGLPVALFDRVDHNVMNRTMEFVLTIDRIIPSRRAYLKRDGRPIPWGAIRGFDDMVREHWTPEMESTAGTRVWIGGVEMPGVESLTWTHGGGPGDGLVLVAYRDGPDNPLIEEIYPEYQVLRTEEGIRVGAGVEPHRRRGEPYRFVANVEPALAGANRAFGEFRQGFAAAAITVDELRGALGGFARANPFIMHPYHSRRPITKEAKERAKKLLHDRLSLSQRATWKFREHFWVTGQSGRKYRIEKSTHGNVWSRSDKRYFCLTLPGAPSHDLYLAQKLMLEGDEERFREEAYPFGTEAGPRLLE